MFEERQSQQIPGADHITQHSESTSNINQLSGQVSPLVSSSFSEKTDFIIDLDTFQSGNIQSLKKLLIENGIVINSEDELIDILKDHWAKAKELFTCLKNESADPISSSLIIAEPDGDKCFIYGSIHCWGSGQEYISLFNQALQKHENVLFEQGMTRVFTYHDRAFPVSDWSVPTGADFFKLGFMSGVDPRTYIGQLWSWINPSQGKQDIAHSKLPISIQNERNGLPDHLALEFETKNGIKPDFITIRSAYQAEFMRNWKKGQDKAIHVGGLHATEINYYLKNPIDNERIRSLAAKHADYLENSPLKYKLTYYASSFGAFFYTGAGMALGAAPWAAIAYLPAVKFAEALGRVIVSFL